MNIEIVGIVIVIVVIVVVIVVVVVHVGHDVGCDATGGHHEVEEGEGTEQQIIIKIKDSDIL